MITFISLLFAEDVVHGLDVAVGKVHDVHVVSVPGAVPGVVIVPVHRDLIAPPDGHLEDVRRGIKLFVIIIIIIIITWAM